MQIAESTLYQQNVSIRSWFLVVVLLSSFRQHSWQSLDCYAWSGTKSMFTVNTHSSLTLNGSSARCSKPEIVMSSKSPNIWTVNSCQSELHLQSREWSWIAVPGLVVLQYYGVCQFRWVGNFWSVSLHQTRGRRKEGDMRRNITLSPCSFMLIHALPQCIIWINCISTNQIHSPVKM